MFGIRRRPKERDPDVVKAMAERDALMGELEVAVRKVDRMQNEIIDEYKLANGLRREEVER